jgi:RNA polymerase sigma-70 factor (ECF subfamily)
MGDRKSTIWSVVDGAAAGRPVARERFVRLYTPVVQAYLKARWRGTPLIHEVEDALQETFVDCFRDDGALTRVDRNRGSFRSFLLGVTRNIALRHERAAARRPSPPASRVDLDRIAARDESLSRSFDRAWALAIVRHAATVHHERAHRRGGRAKARAEILRLRFADDLPVRAIADRMGLDPERVHREYATARREFHRTLTEVVRRALCVEPGRVDEECRQLIQLLRT